MSGYVLRPRSAGEILDAAFQMFRAHWVALVSVTAVFVAPILLLNLVVPVQHLGFVDRFSNLFYLAATGAVALLVSRAVLGQPLDVGAAVRAVGPRFLSLWGAAIGQGILVFLGLLMLVVPGLIFLAWTVSMTSIVMIEGRRMGDAFTRSRELAKGNIGRILLTIVPAFLATLLVIFGLGMAVAILVDPAGRAFVILTELLAIATTPLVAVTGTLIYYDLRIRKEAFDVQVLADQLGEAPPPADVSPAY